MTARWAAMLAGLSLIAALALALLLRSPLSTSAASPSLAGQWIEIPPFPRADMIGGPQVLLLKRDGRFTFVSYRFTRYPTVHQVRIKGTWKVVQPGVMQWNGTWHGWLANSGPAIWDYSFDGDTLQLIYGFMTEPLNYHRVSG